jgi:hypothetical protein
MTSPQYTWFTGTPFRILPEEVMSIVNEVETAVAGWRDVMGDYLPDSMPLLENKISCYLEPQENISVPASPAS